MTVNSISNLEVFNSAIRSWNAGDLDGYLSMYDESVRNVPVTVEIRRQASIASGH
jgi:hypothetical protein